VKPIEIASLREIIREKLANPVARRPAPAESVASILDHDVDATIQDWMALVEQDEELTRVPLSFEDRSSHLPKHFGWRRWSARARGDREIAP
jgi:hypothetical protein